MKSFKQKESIVSMQKNVMINRSDVLYLHGNRYFHYRLFHQWWKKYLFLVIWRHFQFFDRGKLFCDDIHKLTLMATNKIFTLHKIEKLHVTVNTLSLSLFSIIQATECIKPCWLR
jgi:hypothetical protein